MKILPDKIYDYLFPEWKLIGKYKVTFVETPHTPTAPFIFIEESLMGRKRSFVELVNGRKYYNYNYAIAMINGNESEDIPSE